MWQPDVLMAPGVQKGKYQAHDLAEDEISGILTKPMHDPVKFTCTVNISIKFCAKK
jgi:hypothetical protein